MARVIADAGLNGGAIVRPWFGARLQTVTSDIAASMGMPAPHGTLITELAPGGPAANATALPIGDVILSVDGVAVDDPSAFNFRLATRKVGTKTIVSRIHNGQTADIPMTVEAAPVADTAKVEWQHRICRDKCVRHNTGPCGRKRPALRRFWGYRDGG